MSTIIQRSFAGGEISPKFWARADIQRFFNSTRTMRNFIVPKDGGATNRGATTYVREVADSSKRVRLIPFEFSEDDTYILEFGNLYMRVVKNGAPIVEATKNITAITNASPGVITSNSHGYIDNQEVHITGIVGPIGQFLNNRNFKVDQLSANTYSLKYMDGTPVNTTAFGAYTSGGTSARVYEIVTPYLEADLKRLKFVQSLDVLSIVHPSYPPADVSRLGDASWTYALTAFQPSMMRPTITSRNIANTGSVEETWQVTAIAQNGEESYPSWWQQSTVTGITKANPAVVSYTDLITSPAPPLNGQIIKLDGVVGMTQVNGRTLVVRNVNTGAGTFELYTFDGDPVDSTGYTTYGSGGTVYIDSISVGTSALSNTNYVILVWNQASYIPSAKEFNIYRRKNGIYGLVGIVNGNLGTFKDVGIDPDTSITPPIYDEPFNEVDDYPGAIGFYQQRKLYGRPNANKEQIRASRIGKYNNFTKSNPSQDDDAIDWKISSLKYSEVRNLLDIGKLVAFTGTGEHAHLGNDAGILTPTAINPRQQTYNGSDYISPIVIDDIAVYLQSRGNVIRSLGYQYERDGYRGDDLTAFAYHLFKNKTIVDWDFQQIPDSMIWAVRDDGTLLGMTFLREQQILAWHHHDFDGEVENVCCIPEGREDAVYLVIKREVDGQTKRYIERMDSRIINDIVDSPILDSYLSYDGRNVNPAFTMTLSGGTTWEHGEALVLTASQSFFAASDVGNAIQLYIKDEDGNITDTLRCDIVAYTSGTVVTVNPGKLVPVSLRTVATIEWAKAVKIIDGLWHIEGKKVSVFADSVVVASVNNAKYTSVTVEDGRITLVEPYAVVHVGLPITSDLETLNIDTAQGETLIDKAKFVGQLTIQVDETRGLWAGGRPPKDDSTDPLEGLTEYQMRDDNDNYDPVALKTGEFKVDLQSDWNSNGRVFIRQVDPVPCSVQAVAPSGWFPFRG